jgi:hypothetical protein
MSECAQHPKSWQLSQPPACQSHTVKRLQQWQQTGMRCTAGGLPCRPDCYNNNR